MKSIIEKQVIERTVTVIKYEVGDIVKVIRKKNPHGLTTGIVVDCLENNQYSVFMFWEDEYDVFSGEEIKIYTPSSHVFNVPIDCISDIKRCYVDKCGVSRSVPLTLIPLISTNSNDQNKD